MRRAHIGSGHLQSIPSQSRDVFFNLLVTANQKKRLLNEFEVLQEKIEDIQRRMLETEIFFQRLLKEVNEENKSAK